MDQTRAPRSNPAAEPLDDSLSTPSIESALGPLIEACRRTEGMSRADLAERVGVPEGVVALWEDPAYSAVDLSILSRVARATGRRLDVRFTSPRRPSRRTSRPAWEDLLSS